MRKFMVVVDSDGGSTWDGFEDMNLDGRIDLVVGVGYDADIAQVKNELQAIADAEERIIQDKGVTIGVNELADSSVNLVFRSWVATSDYWPTRFDLIEAVKTEFDKEGISIPFPQRDVHMHQVA